jgi:hypothetical protein
MITPELLDYIKSNLASGHDIDKIKSELRNSGWQNEDIDAAISSVGHDTGGAMAPGMTFNNDPHNAPRPWIKEIFIAIAGLLILGGGASAAGYYYLVPPKPEKMIKLAAVNMRNVHSFDYSGDMVISVSSQAGLFSLDHLLQNAALTVPNTKVAGSSTEKFDIKFSGTADVTDTAHPKSDINLNFNYSLLTFGLEARLVDQILYVKADQLPKLGEYDLTKYSNTWIKVDPKELGQDYGLGVNLNQKSTELTEGQKQEIVTAANKAHLFNTVIKLTDDTIDGKPMYHYAFDVDMNGLKDYLLQVERIENSTSTTGENLDNVQILNPEVWIGKKDRMIYKVAGQIADRPTAGTTQAASGSANIVVNFKNFNNPSPIAAPKDFKNYKDVIAEFTQSTMATSLDQHRYSDIQLIATDLELYYNDHGKYPTSLNSLKPSYLNSIPVAPAPNGNCTSVQNTYTYSQVSGGKDYLLSFCLGSNAAGLAAGPHSASSKGLK